MQGKQGYTDNDFDPQFMDAAWYEMKAMLEEELPVGETVEERRFYKRDLVLLLLLIGISVGLSWSYFYKNDLETDNPVVEISTPEKLFSEAGSDVKSNLIIGIPENKSLTAKKDVGFLTNTKEENFVKKKTKLLEENLITSNLDLPKTKIKQAPIAVPFSVEMEKKEEEKLTAAVFDAQFSKDKASVEEPLFSENSKATFSPVYKIPMLRGEVVFDKKEKISVWANQEKISILQRLIPGKFGLELGLFSPGLKQFNSWKIGLGVAYKLSPRLELRTGLNFEQYQKSIAYAYSENINDLAAPSFGEPAYSIEDSDPFGDPSYFDPEYNTTGNLILKTKYYRLDKIRYISLPVVVSLYPSRFWSVNLGARFAKPGKLKGTVLSGNAGQEKEVVNILLERELRKINTSIITGLTIHPHKNIGLNLNYNFAIGDIINEGSLRVTDGSNLNNNFEISMNWYLFNR